MVGIIDIFNTYIVVDNIGENNIVRDKIVEDFALYLFFSLMKIKTIIIKRQWQFQV